MNKKCIYLSYEMSPCLSSYGNGEPVNIERKNSIKQGDSSNTSVLRFSSHFGTHIDFPYHFSETGLKGSNYKAEDFFFNRIKLIDISKKDIHGYIINPEDISVEELDPSVELLIIKTGYCQYRCSDKYWERYPGFSPALASILKTRIPGLQAVGFDLISISSWQRREIGRIAHKEFVIDHNILLIEDMDLLEVNESTIFSKVIIAPLRYENADGSPVTIFAEIYNEN